jgi:hypothetical protein
VAAQRCSKLGGPLVGEEQAAAVDLHDVGGAGDGVPQPVGPLAAEEGVVGAPDDERRDLQAAQGGFDRQQVAALSAGQSAVAEFLDRLLGNLAIPGGPERDL